MYVYRYICVSAHVPGNKGLNDVILLCEVYMQTHIINNKCNDNFLYCKYRKI